MRGNQLLNLIVDVVEQDRRLARLAPAANNLHLFLFRDFSSFYLFLLN